MAVNWAERVSAFSCRPSHFLSGTNAEAFLAELLRELRDDRASDSVKVLMLFPLCEHPSLLCPSDSIGEETALELMSVFLQCPSKSLQLRCHLLLAITSVIVCTSCVSSHTPVSVDFIDLLLQLSQNNSDVFCESSPQSIRSIACDSLRELEACCPGLLFQHIELLGGLRQQETTLLHQAYAGLYVLVLRNAVYQLTQETEAGAEHLKALLGANASITWEADRFSCLANKRDLSVLSCLIRGPMGFVPTLKTGPDCKELRSVLSSLLEESYLLTPLCQAAMLHRLTEVVAMVPGVHPAIFRAQILRLLGTSQVCLLHTTLLMKYVFTDSLFSAEDEAFMLKRLVVLAQHPLLSTSEKLFYMDCMLHFPENRPISCNDGDEALPVLLTPQLASVLLPTVLNESFTMLARFNMMSLVYLDEVEGGEEGDGKGLAYLNEHLNSLLSIVRSCASRDVVVAFFRAAFLYLMYFCHIRGYSCSLIEKLCELYLHHTKLAPHLITLINHIQNMFPESDWAEDLLKALQRAITQSLLDKLTLQDLHFHLKMLARIAQEAKIPQGSTLKFLADIITSTFSTLCTSDWCLGNSILEVCHRLLLHPSLETMLVPLADVLQHLACCYGDTDIQDHACLYYALLTTLSREKLGGVFTRGKTEEGQQVKTRTLSTLVAESEGLTKMLTVQQSHEAVFSLNKVRTEIQETKADAESHVHSTLGEANATLEVYRAQFKDPDFASEIILNYQMDHINGHNPYFEQLFSIHLHCSLTDDNFEKIDDIIIPYLFRDRPSPVVKLRMKPRRPCPTTLQVTALFTTQDGLSWHTVLPDIHVDFQYIFIPLPSPQGWGRDSKCHLFEQLWNEFCLESGDSASSLFCCQVKVSLVNIVNKHLSSYLISDMSQEEEYKVLFFFPPQFHVLLRIRSDEENRVHFKIATDNWQLLHNISSFLQSITSAKEDTTE